MNDDHTDTTIDHTAKQKTEQLHSHNASWMASIDVAQYDVDEMGMRLADTFNTSPFMQHNKMSMRYYEHQLQCVVEAQDFLIGNAAFRILHGGVAATMLDSIGGIEGMLEIHRRDKGTAEERKKQMMRLATVDMRVDYLAPGRGNQFIATAEVVRMGRKGHTTQMTLVNEKNILIAIGTASYAF